jgi:hypothetical protein
LRRLWKKLTRTMSDNFDPYYKWLGIPPKDQPPHAYRLLGIELFESDREVIDAAANRIMAYLKDLAAGDDGQHSQKLLNEIAQTRLLLLNKAKKAAYDQELQAKLESDNKPAVPAAKKPPPKTAKSAPPPAAVIGAVPAPPPPLHAPPAIAAAPPVVAGAPRRHALTASPSPPAANRPMPSVSAHADSDEPPAVATVARSRGSGHPRRSRNQSMLWIAIAVAASLIVLIITLMALLGGNRTNDNTTRRNRRATTNVPTFKSVQADATVPRPVSEIEILPKLM